MPQDKQPAIIRIWRGRTRRECADEYEAYNLEVGIMPLIKTALGVQAFREDRRSSIYHHADSLPRVEAAAP